MVRAALALSLTLAALPAAADGPQFRGVLPDAGALAPHARPEVLALIVQAVVIGQNCDGFRTTDGQWALLTGSADLIADRLGLSVEAQDDDFWRPAFALLDEPQGCARHGWTVGKALGLLTGLGGRSGD